MSSIFSFIAHRTHLKKCGSGRCGKLFLSPQVHEQRSPFTSLDVAHVDGKTGDLYLIHTGHICLLLRPCASGKSNCSYLTQPSDFLRGSMELHIWTNSFGWFKFWSFIFIFIPTAYELMVWSRNKVASDFSKWHSTEPLKDSPFHQEEKKNKTGNNLLTN